MRISNMHWQQVEAYLQQDDRAVLPLGSTEQHAYLSLSVDSILSSRVAEEAAEPLGIPVFPVVAYGLTPLFTSYPGTLTLRLETYRDLVLDLLDGLVASGFRRLILVNGHGGNKPVYPFILEWVQQYPGVQVRFHNWWQGTAVWTKVQAIDSVASHASWMENFPWTRLADAVMPNTPKPMVDFSLFDAMTPEQVRTTVGDGNFGGYYQRSDAEMLALWAIAVAETRSILTENW